MRREPDIEVLEPEVFDQEASASAVRVQSGGIALAGVCLAVLVGLQLIPGGEPRSSDTTRVAAPAAEIPTISVQAQEILSEFQWVQVAGIDRFESVTHPLPMSDGYLAVANPWGLSRAASVVVSADGSQWNRLGTIHGVGGDIAVNDIGQFADMYMAIGTYTESMPKNEFAVHPRLPAVWMSDDGIAWEMQTLPTQDAAFVPMQLMAGEESAIVTGHDANPYLHTPDGRRWEAQRTAGDRVVGVLGDRFVAVSDIGLVKTSLDGLNWSLAGSPQVLPKARQDQAGQVVSVSTDHLIGTQVDQVWQIETGELRTDGYLEYFGDVDTSLAILRRTATATVTIREPGLVGDSFARRMDSVILTLLITQDRAFWKSQVVPFDDISFNGGVGGAFLVRTSSGGDPDQSSYWLVTP